MPPDAEAVPMVRKVEGRGYCCGFGVIGLGFRIWGVGFMVEVLRVQGFELGGWGPMLGV